MWHRHRGATRRMSFCLLWCESDISLDEEYNACKQLAALPLSDRVSVIKRDGLSFVTQTLAQTPQTPHSPSSPSPIHFGSLYSSRVNCCAVDSPWKKKHKSWKQPDMSETSPWLWWVTTGAEQQWAAVAEADKQQVRVWGMSWGSVILIRHNDSPGLDLSPFLPPPNHNSFCPCSCWAAVDWEKQVISVGYWIVVLFILVQMNSVPFWVQCL